MKTGVHPEKEAWFGAKLQCPLCGGDLSSEGLGRYDVLRCYCSLYPVIEGIPVLKWGRIGTGGQTTEEIARWIRAGRTSEALLALISPSSPALAPAWAKALPPIIGVSRFRRILHERAARVWSQNARLLLNDQGNRTTACQLFELYFHNPRKGYDYFAYRFGQPRHLVALSFASLIQRPKRPVLELACGFGHITRSLIQRAGSPGVFGLDSNFFALLVASRWIAPGGRFICCDADTFLPFPDASFSTVFCSDAFQCFRNKVTAIREMKRLLEPNGLILVTAIRNSLVPQATGSGVTVPPEAVGALVEDMPHCLLADSAVLERYLQFRGPVLSCSVQPDELAKKSLFSVVATRHKDVFRDHGAFEELPHAGDHLALNPLYQQEPAVGSDKVLLRRVFPSTFYEEENMECKGYLPEAVWINRDTLSDLSGGRMSPEIGELMRQIVVLSMPERYGAPRPAPAR